MIRIYTVENCPYCNELKSLLLENSIEFVEINTDLPENQMEYLAIYKISKCDSVPVIKVNNNLLLPNVSFKTIKEAIEVISGLLKQ